MQHAGAQPVPQVSIANVGEKTPPQHGDRRCHTVAQVVKGARALILSGPGPPLELAVSRTLGLDTRLVAKQPEQREVGKDLARHHGLEVEFDKGLARETCVIAEDAEGAAIRDKAPEMIVRVVEKLLDQAVRARAICAWGTSEAAAELDVEPDEMDQRVLPGMRNRVTLAVDLNRLGRDQSPVTKLLE